jgi:hypothetical protein
MKKLSHDSTDAVKAETAPAVVVRERLFGDIRLLIESAKSHLAQTANTILVTLYWNVGKRIKAEILGNERAQYGKEIVSALGRQLTAEHVELLQLETSGIRVAEYLTELLPLAMPFEALLFCFENCLYLPCSESSFWGK